MMCVEKPLLKYHRMGKAFVVCFISGVLSKVQGQTMPHSYMNLNVGALITNPNLVCTCILVCGVHVNSSIGTVKS